MSILIKRAYIYIILFINYLIMVNINIKNTNKYSLNTIKLYFFFIKYNIMNVLEAFIKKNKKIILLLSGITNPKFKELANTFKNDLNLPLININEIIKKDFYEKISESELEEIKKEIKKHKSFILVGFIIPKIKYNFHYNIKFDNKYLIEKNLENSNEILKNYKEFLNNNKVNKFIKYENEKDELILDELFNHIMELISKDVYKEDTIFQKKDNIENKKEDSEPKVKDNIDSYEKIREQENKDLKQNLKYKKKWDPDNEYLDIEEYNERMLNIPIHDENDDSLDEDIFLEMNFPSLTSQQNNYFVKDFYYKNFKGGNIKNKNNLWGFRYMKNL